MTDLVPADQIEGIVGAKRHPLHHLGRVVPATQTVYILHSQRCKDSGIDLRDCDWSRALDRGINESEWRDCQDRPVVLHVWHGTLMPVDWEDLCDEADSAAAVLDRLRERGYGV